MVDLDDLNETIEQLELRCESIHACERLAWLYIVRDHIAGVERTTIGMQGSEFLELASGVPYSQLMRVLDEHMEAVKVVQPKEYEAVMEKITGLRPAG